MARILPARFAASLLAAAFFAAACTPAGPPATAEELAARAKGGDGKAVAALIGLLGAESDIATRSLAYAALLESGPEAAKAALAAAADSDPVRREHALALIGNLKPEGAFEASARALADPSFSRRHAAAWALGEIGDPRALPLLAETLPSVEPDIAARQTTRALARFGGAAVPVLMKTLPSLAQPRRGYVLRVLGELRDPAAKPALAAALADPNTREDAVWALGTMGKTGERVRLAPYLDDADWRVRVEAARAVGLLEEREAVPALERLRGSDPVIAVREWAARGLALLTGEPEPYRNASGEWQAPDTLYH